MTLCFIAGFREVCGASGRGRCRRHGRTGEVGAGQRARAILPERIRLGASAGEGHADAGDGFDDAGGELDQAQRAGLDARHHPACGLAPDLRGVARLGRAAQFD